VNYDGYVLAAVVSELRDRLLGGHIQQVRQHNETDITIEIRSPGNTWRLFFSVDPRFPRVYLTASALSVPQTALQFCMVARKHLVGLYVADVSQVGMDRVLRITASRHGGPSQTLVFELMGRHSNLILLDGSEKILGSVKHIGSSVSRVRQILPGRPYLPVPGLPKMEIRDVPGHTVPKHVSSPDLPPTPSETEGGGGGVPKSLADVVATAPDEPAAAAQWLIAKWSGVGPVLANELVSRSVVDGRLSHQMLINQLADLAGRIARSEFEPTFFTDDEGAGVMVYPCRLSGFPADRQHARASINEALDALFRSLVSRTDLEDARSQVTTAIRRSISSRKNTLKSLTRSIEESQASERYKQLGELLLANLPAVEKGARIVSVADFYHPELAEVTIELDEKLTPQENADRYFKRYRKSRDAAKTALGRSAMVSAQLAELEEALGEAESASDVESVRRVQSRLTQSNLLRAERSELAAEADPLPGHRIRRVFTADGWEILYGETAQANDYLTQRLARPNDVWLHARSIVGAHVVIRTSGHSAVVPKPLLELASKIAAANSDAKHSSLVPVDHTLRKFVRKPRGAAPGFVTYRNEKTIDINPKVVIAPYETR